MFGAEETTWPVAIIFLGVLLTAMFLIGVAVSGYLEVRKRTASIEQILRSVDQ